MAKKEYRSAVRSRHLIRTAFMELLQEKPFEKITVTDLVRRADINRSTFYAHYPDVQGLVDEILAEPMAHTIQLTQGADYRDFFNDPLPFLQLLSVLLRENQALYRLMARSNYSARQMDMLKQQLIQQTFKAMSFPKEWQDSTFLSIRISFSIGGLVDVCLQWLKGELDCTLDDILEHISAIIVRSASDLKLPEKE